MTIRRIRRRLAYLLLPVEDRCRVSTSLANSPVYLSLMNMDVIHTYNQLLKEMESIHENQTRRTVGEVADGNELG